MTDNEKLQKLFQAALKDVSEDRKPLARAFPDTPVASYTVPRTSVEPVAQEAPAPIASASAFTAFPSTEPMAVALAPDAADLPVMTGMSHDNVGLDAATSAELGALIDERRAKQKRKNRRNLLVTCTVILGLLGSAAGWVATSPERRQVLADAIRDIRSAGDIAATVAKFQASLDRMSERGKQVDQARMAMGVETSEEDEKDPYLQAEMKEMTRGEGKTSGERDMMMKRNFDHMGEKYATDVKKAQSDGLAKDSGKAPATQAADAKGGAAGKLGKKEETFEWDTAPAAAK